VHHMGLQLSGSCCCFFSFERVIGPHSVIGVLFHFVECNDTQMKSHDRVHDESSSIENGLGILYYLGERHTWFSVLSIRQLLKVVASLPAEVKVGREVLQLGVLYLSS
jgi:hypothetical protein